MAHNPKSSVPARKLGRGLSALMGQPVAINLPGAASAPGLPVASTAPVAAAVVAPPAVVVPVGDRIVEIAIELITKNKHQPRTQFDETALNELADSIKRSGVMQPVLVRRAKYGPGAAGVQIAQYELISGERRLRASAIVGLKTVPCVIREINEQESAEWALVENLQREDLGPVEMARAFKRLTVEFGLTQAEIAKQVSINAASVSNHVRLLELEPSILDLVNSKKLSFGHARGLLAMPSVHVSLDPAKSRIAMAERAAREQWSVRKLESEAGAAQADAAAELAGAQGGVGGPGGAADARERAEKVALGRKALAISRVSLSSQLSEQLGTKVLVQASAVTAAGKMKGKVVIDFYSVEQFDGLLGRMGLSVKL